VESRQRCFLSTGLDASVLLEGADHQTLSRSRSFDVTIGQAYDTLGLDASSTSDEARSRFRELMRSNHPDGKPSHEQERANETTRVIVEACTLLRTKGFPLVVVCNGTAEASGSRYERQAAAEPESADRLAWLDVWRECVCSNLVCVMSPAFGVRFALGAWTMGWETVFGNRSKFK
jgi:DnaJ domain